MHQARVLHQTTGKAARLSTGFAYITSKSWSRARRRVAKAEYLDKGENPRFVVNSRLRMQIGSGVIAWDGLSIRKGMFGMWLA